MLVNVRSIMDGCKADLVQTPISGDTFSVHLKYTSCTQFALGICLRAWTFMLKRLP